ncbi:MAG TPA: acyl-CoA dehydrogenase family protein [Chloroflexota bacterium]|nr:acyl-CoA dehydrogenase family protein [Chloroflexota bacterium]
MDFALSADEALFRQTVREFAQTALTPYAAEADATGAFPPAVLRQLAAFGLTGLLVPEAYDGAGVDTLRFVLALEEVARVSAALAAVLNAHNALVCAALAQAGTPAQQARWLPALARGDLLGACGLAEPEGGCDLTRLCTRAVPVGTAWQLDGQKCSVRNGGLAGLYVIYAVTDPAAAPPGVSAFLVARDTPGLQVGPPLETMGLRGLAMSDVALVACGVPREALLGVEHRGHALATATCALARLGTAAQALGIAQSALDAALAYVQERRQFGRPIAQFEGVRWLLADLHRALEAARLLTYRAAWLRDRGQPFAAAAAMARLQATETATQATIKAVQLFGGYGYMAEAAVQRHLRDAQMTAIDEGLPGSTRAALADALLPPPP